MSFSRGLRHYLGFFFLTMFVKHFTSIFFLFLLIVQEQLDTLKAFLFYGINNSQNIICFVQPQTHSWAQGNDFLCLLIHLGLFRPLVIVTRPPYVGRWLFLLFLPSCTHWVICAFLPMTLSSALLLTQFGKPFTSFFLFSEICITSAWTQSLRTCCLYLSLWEWPIEALFPSNAHTWTLPEHSSRPLLFPSHSYYNLLFWRDAH